MSGGTTSDGTTGGGPTGGGTTGSGARPPRDGGAPLRLTWTQPEDLLGHELRQAAQDGRDASDIERRWLAAGGHPAPERAGASSAPASPALRATAEQLLDELTALESPLEPYEPTDLAAVKAACPDWPTAAEVPRAGLEERLHAAWLGRAAGCLLGKPVEKLTVEGIRALARSTDNWPLTGYFTERGLDPAVAAAYPWNRRSRTTSLAENIDGMPEDDDLNYPLLALLLLERHGPGFSTGDVAKLWLDELPAGRTFTAERVAYRNLLAGIEPPHTGAYRNPFREWIGAQIRADVFGWTHPGDPAGAAEAAWRDAVLTHTANGVYGEMFTAAALARAAGGGPGVDVDACVAAGLSVVPPGSRYATAVRTGVAAAREAANASLAGFEQVVDGLHAAYGDHHWVHVLPNAALLAAAVTHAGGDFDGAIRRVVSGGWDTDSNGATAGSLTALLAGSPAVLPRRWTAPLKNRLSTSVGDMNGVGFDELAARTTALSTAAARGPDGPPCRPRRQTAPILTAPSPALTVVGSANMDLVAQVASAPRRGETIAGRSFTTVPGGKGANQAIAAARSGSAVSMIGAVGDDAFGAGLREALTASGVEVTGLRTAATPTGTAHIVVDDEGGNAIVVVPGANATVTALTEDDERRIAQAQALLLQLETPLEGVLSAARAAHAHGVRTVLTPAPVPVEPLPDELLGLIDLLVPNEHEAAALSGKADPHEAAAALLERVPEVVVTLGAAGSLYAARGAEPVTVPAVRVRAVDTTAAGDTFVGALCTAYAEGRTVPEAMAWASAASALAVQRPGASSSMPDRTEITQFATKEVPAS